MSALPLSIAWPVTNAYTVSEPVLFWMLMATVAAVCAAACAASCAHRHLTHRRAAGPS